VVGQDQAISAVANALRRSRAGLKEAKKPIASFMFFGPTGVGKTEVAKTLAEVYYGSEKLMIRIDMSEFQEEENVARLIGKQADASFTGGYLTEAVRKKPFSLILLDEIEKANPKVLDLLLQILDEGRVTDGAGRQIDFTNCIIIATSNAASKQIADLIGRGQKYTEVLKAVQPLLTDTFRIEFLNRFDKIIMFKPLLPIEVEQIADRMLQELADNLMEKGYGLEYTRDMVSELVKLGYNPLYGAREVRRVIQDEVENRIASAVINGELKPGGTIKWSSIDNYQIT
jgi:ATP-dependent Clp protease ATP-binding subunit ClpB